MNERSLGAMEARFADIVWENQPLASGALARLCEEQLNWKRTTTYTVLKKLCDRGLFQNVGGTVTALMSREEFYSFQSEKFVEETFDGSLPAFLAAFTTRKSLTEREIAEIQQMIDSFGKER